METTFKKIIVELALSSLITEIRLVNEYYDGNFKGEYEMNGESGQAYIIDGKEKISVGVIDFTNAMEALRFPYRFTAPVFDILVAKYKLTPKEECGPQVIIEESEEQSCQETN